MVVVFLAILLLFGAKNLPRMARTIGKTLEELRRASRDVTNEIMRADIEPPPTLEDGRLEGDPFPAETQARDTGTSVAEEEAVDEERV